LRRVEDEIAFSEKKLSNPRLIQNAPPHIVDQQKAKLQEYLANKEAILANLKALGVEK